MNCTLVHTSNGPDSTQVYGYDDRDRLTWVEDTYQGSCFVRTYGFDQASNRTNFKNYIPDANGGCQNQWVYAGAGLAGVGWAAWSFFDEC